MRVMATTHETASLLFAHDVARWAAVALRGRHSDGLFYDAVLTTGAYRRPSYPARLIGGRQIPHHG